ncbi:uncharacterized protein LOC135348526 [Halichondria panicea]|uniref:uncharacterized protein LOC135348526 n=1 Tax=Halichondria panicea TaxID=6063 RepID=UPI00312B8136
MAGVVVRARLSSKCLLCVRGLSEWSAPIGRPAPVGSTPSIPFCVHRSKYKNLPVYTDYKSGRSQVLTRVTKVDGDVMVLERMLRQHLGVDGLRSRADEITGSVTLIGNHRDQVIKWLKNLGF